MHHARKSNLLLASLLVVTAPAWAGGNETVPFHAEAPGLAFSLVRVIGALAVVFALFLAGVWVFRNWQRLTVPRGRAPKLNVLEVKSLGPRHALYVIGYEQQRFLLSSAPTGIAMLAALPAATAAEAAEAATPAGFAEILAATLSRGRRATGGTK